MTSRRGPCAATSRCASRVCRPSCDGSCKLARYIRGQSDDPRATWFLAANLPGLATAHDVELACHPVEAVQAQNTRAGKDRTYHLVVSLHPEDRSLQSKELSHVVESLVDTLGFSEHQYIAARHNDKDHEHLHVAINKIHPESFRLHSPSWDHQKLLVPGLASSLRYAQGDFATIFMLHRVLDGGAGAAHLNPMQLRRGLEHLRRNGYEVVSLAEVFRRLAGEGPRLHGTVAFTIDDGYLDQAEIAGPIFSEFDCPVTTFVTTGFLDGALWLWWDKIEYVFSNTRRFATS
jgi:hypothetical protein